MQLPDVLEAVFERGTDQDKLSNAEIMQALEAFTKRPGLWTPKKLTQTLNNDPWCCEKAHVGVERGLKNLKLRVNAQAAAAPTGS